jgi:hypothetical protein
MKTLPPLPRSVYFPAGRVKVKRVKELKVDNEKSFGAFDWATRTIEIDQAVGLNGAWYTLYHEVMHCILFDAGVYPPDPKLLEQICDAYGAYRVAEMLK